MNGGWVFLIILLIALIGGYGGWVLWSRIRASRLGLPPPSLNPFDRSGSSAPNYPAPAPGGIRGFIETQIRKFKNRNNRQAAGAYEEPSSSYNSARGRGAGNRLDPDEAWSARVGDEAYYEEQELGLHAPAEHTGYHSANAGYGGAAGYPSGGGGGGGYEGEHYQPQGQQQQRGRSRTREYEEESLHTDGRSARDPFGDDNAASLRGVSPRPLDHGQDTSYGGASAGGSAQNPALKKVPTGGSAENSPTERRSMFRENM